MSLVSASATACKARAFRAAHAFTRLSLVGYSSAPIKVEAEYAQLVDVSVERMGPSEHETQTCLCCGEIVFEADHG